MEMLERTLEERLAEALAKLATLEEAAWAMLVALEMQEPEEILKARQKLRAVFLDL